MIQFDIGPSTQVNNQHLDLMWFDKTPAPRSSVDKARQTPLNHAIGHFICQFKIVMDTSLPHCLHTIKPYRLEMNSYPRFQMICQPPFQITSFLSLLQPHDHAFPMNTILKVTALYHCISSILHNSFFFNHSISCSVRCFYTFFVVFQGAHPAFEGMESTSCYLNLPMICVMHEEFFLHCSLCIHLCITMATTT